MDFGKILDDWDSFKKKERKQQEKTNRNQQKALGPKPNPGPRAGQTQVAASSTLASERSTFPHEPKTSDKAIRKPSESSRPVVNPNDYLNHWLVLHGTQDKDASGLESEDDRQARIQNAQRLRNLAPEATIDLHGKTAAEAEADLGRFLAACSREGLEKVLIIHGKGNHSENEGIMTDLVRRVLENSDLAARFGFEDRQHGGRGATWVILRKRDYFSR